jgi:Orsellinic acid/F9775 biosynthesis cluster protein D
MSHQEVKNYITYLPEFQVVVCRFCEIGIPPKNPLRHYEQNHTSKKDHPVAMEIRRKVAEYMTTLDLLEPDKVISPRQSVPHLKTIEHGFICNFPGCDQCSTSESSMLTHYYTHQKHIPKGFKDWKSTSIQTFFEGHHRKYGKSFVC